MQLCESLDERKWVVGSRLRRPRVNLHDRMSGLGGGIKRQIGKPLNPREGGIDGRLRCRRRDRCN